MFFLSCNQTKRFSLLPGVYADARPLSGSSDIDKYAVLTSFPSANFVARMNIWVLSVRREE